MKNLWITLICGISVLGGVSVAKATPLPTDLILDRGPLGNYCGNLTTGCYGAAATSGKNPNTNDVVGGKNDFDAKSIQFTTWTANRIVGDIIFNFHSGDTSLADFPALGFTLKVGDLLFTGGGLKFGVALTTHDGLNAGQLYQVNDFLTSDQMGFDNSEVIWRDAYWCAHYGGSCVTPAVRMDGAGASALGNVVNPVVVSHFDEGLYAAGIELKAHLDFNPGGAGSIFWQTYKNSGGLDVSFADATCANDIIDGHVTPASVPAPSPFLSIFAAVLALTVWTRGRRRLIALRSR